MDWPISSAGIMKRKFIAQAKAIIAKKVKL